MNLIERIVYAPRRGTFREYRGLMTCFAPRDLALYRSLLPAALDMPAEPLVFVYAVDFSRVSAWPMATYREWACLLSCAFRGRAGAHAVIMPVTARVPYWGGVYMGYPKYIADEITLTRSGDAVAATGRYRGVTQLTLAFTPGIARALAPHERALVEDERFFKGDTYQLVPPGRGTRVCRVVLQQLTPPRWSPVPGMIRLEMDASERWAGLVPDADAFVGVYNRFVGAMNLIPEWQD